MPKMPVQCPSCGGPLVVEGLACDPCASHLQGSFDIHPLLRLADDDLAFVLAFVRASGSLKDMATLLGQSYPTVRNRLDAIIAALGKSESTQPNKQRQILNAVASGTLSVKQAIKRLKEVGS